MRLSLAAMALLLAGCAGHDDTERFRGEASATPEEPWTWGPHKVLYGDRLRIAVRSLENRTLDVLMLGETHFAAWQEDKQFIAESRCSAWNVTAMTGVCNVDACGVDPNKNNDCRVSDRMDWYVVVAANATTSRFEYSFLWSP